MGNKSDLNIDHVENEINTFDQHAGYFRSFDRTIPGHVDFFPLGNDCKYFYAIIRSLAFSKGYCWATNKFLAEQAKVSTRTVERYIRCLKSCELIQVEYFRIKNGYENRRKIWINEALISQKVAQNEALLREIQKSLPTAKTCGPGSDETCGPGTTQNGGQLTKLNNKEENNCFVKREAPEKEEIVHKSDAASIVKLNPAGEEVHCSKEAYYTHCVMESHDWAPAEIEEAWKILVSYEGSLNNWKNFLDGIVKRQRVIKENEKDREKSKWKNKNSQMNKSERKLTADNKPSATSKRKISGADTLGQASPNWVKTIAEIMKPPKSSQLGSPNPETS